MVTTLGLVARQNCFYSSARSLPMDMLLSFLLFSIVGTASALTCYETENGQTTIKHNDTWLYCSFVPATLHRHEHTNGTRFGLGHENDGVEAYNAAFMMNDRQYRVLTMCIYERLDFSSVVGFKADTAVEFAFRCVCNYDLCNSESTFHSYLKTLREESFIVKN